MSRIFTDFAALVDVTPEMEALRWCPDCKGVPFHCQEGQDEYCGHGHPCNRYGIDSCPTCKGTGLNPDQTAWWEAIAGASYNKLGELLVPLWANGHIDLNVFSDAPQKSFIDGRTMIHRPESDDRPWPEVLRFLIDKAGWLKCKLSFALATKETAPVFKSFGIKTLMEA